MTSARLEQPWETGGDAAADIAAWLAGLFIAPLPIGAVAGYRSTDGARVLEAIGDEVGCKAGTDRMRSALATGSSPASIEHTLSIEYALLFEGVAGLGTVPLYESAYGGEGSRLFRQPTADMELLLQRCGLSVIKDCCEPPDHLSIELALLSVVLREGDKPRVALLLDRLHAWVPQFAARCCESDATGFYSGAAMVLNELLAAPVLRNVGCDA